MPKPGPKSRWTPAVLAQTEEMLGRGMSQAEIAKAFDTTQQTVSRLTRDIHEMRSSQSSDAPEWDVIALNPAAWLAGQPDMLTALIRIQAAYNAKVTSGPLRLDRPDWDEITSQRDAIMAAYRAAF